MSSIDNTQVKSQPAAKSGGSEKFVIALVVLILAATAGYQIFFCPDCYATADRTAVQNSTNQ
jgi:hypothetical protein